MNKAVFLDRDGTIIIDKVYLNDPTQIEYLPKAIEGLKKMCDLGYKLVVVTNQSGVARGIVSLENLHKIHEIIRNDLSKHNIEIADFYYAPYSVESQHPMRKPKPGMLLLGAKEHNIETTKSFMIGDRDTDIYAGEHVGAKTILLAETSPEGCHPNLICKDLLEAADFISQHT